MPRTRRDRPPASSLRWAEAAAGPGARVARVRRLSGGKSSAVHALDLRLPSGATQRLVLRRHLDADWLALEPDLAAHEAAVLRLLEATAVPAPRLVAVDKDGSAAGVPSVLMTWLPGRVELAPGSFDVWLRRMAGLLPTIHAVHPAPEELPGTYAPYTSPNDVNVPSWTSRPDAWQSIIDYARGPRPAATECLIHRDYHPSNILWQRRRITGIVDWVNACRGPGGVDIGHCRRNLAILHGVDIADRLLDFCLEWADYDPYWDILSLLDAELDEPVYAGWLDLGVTMTPGMAHSRLDGYAVSLAARL